jgi:hypothetical protein
MTSAKDLIDACEARNRAIICRLIAAIPEKVWEVIPGRATSYLPPVTIQVWHASGGSGINTYETVHVQILLDGQVLPRFASTFTAEELQIPNYISKEVRSQAAKSARPDSAAAPDGMK